jgi:microcystin-dependent protein
MSLLFKNNATGRLRSNTLASSTLLTLDTGEGNKFPLPGAGDWFWVTLDDRREGKIEICKCTARSTDNLTVVRAQEGTVALDFLAGAIVSNRFTAQTLADILNAVAWDKPTTDARFINASGDAMTGPLTVLAPLNAMEPTTKQYVDAKPGFADAPNDANMYGRQANAWIVAVRDSDYTDAIVLTKVKRVDGAGSGLDADMLDGQEGTYYATAAGLTANNDQTALNTSNIATLTTQMSAKANINSPALTGVPTAPTAGPGTNSPQIATTEFVMASITTSGGFPEAPNDGGIYGRQSLGWRDISPDLFGKVAKAGDTMTGHLGLPTGPAAANAVRKDYVDTADAARAPLVHTHAQADVTNLVTDLAAKAPLASPALTGVPTAPTAAGGTSSTQLATTAFVATADALKANLDSPVFTGNPTAPTPAAGDNDQSIATTAFVKTALASGVPAGAVMHFAMITPPTGWLKANGTAVSRTTYAALFAAIGTTFGVGDGSTTFGLPDLRGEFVRGFDDGRTVDNGRVFGSAQLGGVESHTHAVSGTTAGNSADHTHGVNGTTATESVDHTHTFSDASSATGGVSANHTHTFADSSSATGTGSANHTHTYTATIGSGVGIAGGAQNPSVTATTSASGAAHTHTVGVSGTTGGNSVTHTHTVAVSGTTGGRSAAHTHALSFNSGLNSVDHTHTFSATSTANSGAITETRPRNIALMACIKT